MIAVIFEVQLHPERQNDYRKLATMLAYGLEGLDGFISIERFASLADDDRILSLSFWRDEKAVQRWRENAEHRAAQEAGRSTLFADYRVRVAAVLRDYGLSDRKSAPPSVGPPQTCA